MLIDDVKIKVTAGKGGDGLVSFDRIKMSRGPDGGDGGKGGNVIFIGESNLGLLNQFRYKKEISARNGQGGGRNKRSGAFGDDVRVKIPVGTVIRNLTSGFDEEMMGVGQEIVVARGGRGGKGNFFFRSSRNTTPMQAQPGLPGEEFELRLELKLIADVGFIGFPNAGKSSLLNAITNASARVANYPFTTLEPNLGVYYDLVLADVPGLIEGASDGKGLGTRFLRHIERTRVLFHLVSAESEDVEKDYLAIRKELENYSKSLAEKEEYLFLSKVDLVREDDFKEKLEKLRKLNPNAMPLSVLDDSLMTELKKILNKVADTKKQVELEAKAVEDKEEKNFLDEDEEGFLTFPPSLE